MFYLTKRKKICLPLKCDSSGWEIGAIILQGVLGARKRMERARWNLFENKHTLSLSLFILPQAPTKIPWDHIQTYQHAYCRAYRMCVHRNTRRPDRLMVLFTQGSGKEKKKQTNKQVVIYNIHAGFRCEIWVDINWAAWWRLGAYINIVNGEDSLWVLCLKGQTLRCFHPHGTFSMRWQ